MIEPTDHELAELERTIDCPVPWCEGRWLAHGGDGAAPDEWLHDEGDNGVELVEGAWLSRSQVGADEIDWALRLSIGNGDSARVGVDSDLATLVARLRIIADAIDRVRSSS